MMNETRLRWLLLVALGAAAALGQAPFDVPFVMVVAMAIAVRLGSFAVTPRAAAACGFAFGFGYFAVALHWIVSPFLVDVARHGWMAPFAVVMMATGGATFWSIAFWGARRLSRGIWALVPCWTAVELARAYIFTGFPWASPAQAMVDKLPGQALAWVGPHGLNLMIFAAAVLMASLVAKPWRLRFVALVPLGMVMLEPSMANRVENTGTVLRLIQPNAPQHEKWDPDKIGIFYKRQLLFTAAEPDAQLGAPDLIIWPETAIPWGLHGSEVILEEISAAAKGVPVILGAQRNEDQRHFNALAVLGPLGEITQIYDKYHLVPFGEYVPFGDFLARFGIYGMAPQHGAGFSKGAGPQLLDLGPLGRALPLICYEAVFAQDVNAAPARPDFIIHATNDAWFGTHAGPQQHLAQARMRAIEQGLPVARAANTGISAIIDPHGRVLDSLGLGQAGYADAALPQALAPTLYSKTGDVPLTLLVVALLCFAVMRRMTRQRRLSE